MQTISIRQSKLYFPRLIERVQEGEEFLITSNGEPVALLKALPDSKSRIPENPAKT